MTIQGKSATPKNRKPGAAAPQADQCTKEQIVATAMRLYANGGLKAVSMRAIARELSVTQMAASRHFKSEEDIFTEIRMLVFDNFGAHLEAAFSSGNSPTERLVRYAYAYVEFARQAPADYKFIFDLWPREQYKLVLRREGEGALARSRAFYVQLMVAGDMIDAEAEYRRVLEAAHIVWQTLHGLVSLHTAKKLGFGLTLDDLIHPTLVGLVSGLFPGHDSRTLPKAPAPVAVKGLISGPSSSRKRSES
jgi:AcrR family transcriptional regulator